MPVQEPLSPDSAIGSPELASPENSKPSEQLEGMTDVQQQPASANNNPDDVDSNEDEEDSLSESEMVVTGSMQFALTPAAVTQISSTSTPVSDAAGSDSTVISLDSGCDGNINIDHNVKPVTPLGISTLSGSQKHVNTDTNSIQTSGTLNSDACAISKPPYDSSSHNQDSVKDGESSEYKRTEVLLEVSNSSSNSLEGYQSDRDDSDPVAVCHLLPLPRVKRLRRKRRRGMVGLPPTVTRLSGPNGCQVYVVGTAHFSRESQQDVVTTIERVRPDVLVLELCRSRTAILSLDEQTIIEESTNMDFAKMRSVITQHGRVQGVLYLLLLSVSAHITRQLGMAPGGEFRVAVSTARRVVPNASIQLGDRPINITLSRALSALSLWSKIKLAFHIITTTEPISKEDVEKCKNKDMIEELLAEMTGQFPAISEVFVTERDKFLSHSLYVACRVQPGAGAVLEPRRVVGVVGIGHLKGIEQHWGKVQHDEINRILTIPPNTLTNRVISLAARGALWGVAGYICYRLLMPSAAKTALKDSFVSSLAAISATAAAAVTTAKSRPSGGL